MATVPAVSLMSLFEFSPYSNLQDTAMKLIYYNTVLTFCANSNIVKVRTESEVNKWRKKRWDVHLLTIQ